MFDLTVCLQVFVAASIFYVWVVHYQDVIEEFKIYGLPDWVRDLTGIMELALSLLMLIGIERKELAILGALGMTAIMIAAFITHLRVKHPVFLMLPAFALLVFSVLIALINYQLLVATGS
jgi:hypothetical protein